MRLLLSSGGRLWRKSSCGECFCARLTGTAGGGILEAPDGPIRLQAAPRGSFRRQIIMTDAVECIVAGHICLDITPELFPSDRSLPELMRPGTLLTVGPATISTGGAVSNTGLALRRLGVNVKLMGKCGDDAFGRMVLALVAAEAPGAETGMRVAAGEHTSYSLVMAPPGADRMFLHCPGANDTFGAADVEREIVRRARLFHFGYPPIMTRMYADDGAELAAVMRDAKADGATTSLDMVYPDPSSPAGRADWRKILVATLPHVDFFTPSAEEVCFMLDRPAWQRMSNAADMLGQFDGALLAKLAERCIRMGAAAVLIKCGHVGMYLRTAGAERLAAGRAAPADAADWADRELLEPTCKVAKVVSATGAGDNAVAGFLAAVLRGCGVADALRYGCAVGAQNVAVRDAVSGVRSWQETTAQIRGGLAKNAPGIALDGWRHDEAAGHYVGPNDGRPVKD